METSICTELIKERITFDSEKKIYIIPSDLSLDKLPENIANMLMDNLNRLKKNKSPEAYSAILSLIRKGELIIECSED